MTWVRPVQGFSGGGGGGGGGAVGVGVVINADAATQAGVNLAAGSCPSSVDTVLITPGLVILVWQQVLPEENGLYLVVDAGTGANDGTWIRLPSMSTDAQLATLALVKVRASGGVSSLLEYIPSTVPPYTVGVTHIHFVLYPTVIGGSSGSILYWGNSGLTTTTTVRFLDPGYVPANAGTVRFSWMVPAPGDLDRLFLRHNTVGVGGTINYTVEVNGVLSPLTVGMLASAVSGSDLAAVVPVVAGDLVTVRVAKPVAITTSPARVQASLRYRPT